MVVLVACETLLLVLLVVLVVGLLRSHAEILRRLGPPREDGDEEFQQDPGLPGQLRQGPSLPSPRQRAGGREGHDVVGTTLAGDAVKLGLGKDAPPTLLAFLSSGCSVCQRFWDDLRSGRRPPELAPGIRFLAVTKDPSEESPARLGELAGAEIPVVMSSAAWLDYGAPAAPYFVYLEAGDVYGEGSASSWRQIASLLRDAIDDQAFVRGGERRTREVDRVLASAGIEAGHPSLYPAGKGEQE
ncbi:MAG: hypothetical protein JO342_11245 [Solirubrobacterales bacterium]|nr:hypothetical protein [Solirubrobacterales bacterium]MBV9166716.1 hypothetical protein [Solirubrobacterales bacterium]